MRTLHRQRETSETDHFKASTGKPRPNFTRAEVEVLLQNVDMSILFHSGYIHAIEFSGYLFIHCHFQCSYCNKSRKCGIFVMAFYYILNTMPKWHGLYALVQVITNRLCYRHTPVQTQSQHRTTTCNENSKSGRASC